VTAVENMEAALAKLSQLAAEIRAEYPEAFTDYE
jgi:hypothetical protein